MTSVIYFVIVRTTRKPTVDDPPKIAGRYTKGAECSAGWLLWNSVCQSIAELTSY